jgi:hypothetical protein
MKKGGERRRRKKKGGERRRKTRKSWCCDCWRYCLQKAIEHSRKKWKWVEAYRQGKKNQQKTVGRWKREIQAKPLRIR